MYCFIYKDNVLKGAHFLTEKTAEKLRTAGFTLIETERPNA